MNPDSYVKEIQSIKEELKRINSHAKKLREQKKAAEKRLYQYMKNNDLPKYEGITIKSITPKEAKPRKPAKAKKSDAINLFYQIGVPDPESFWDEFQQTQRYEEGESPPPKPKKKTKKEYDPFLGY